MPRTWRYTCIGNALVVGLVEEMGELLPAEPRIAEQVDADHPA